MPWNRYFFVGFASRIPKVGHVNYRVGLFVRVPDCQSATLVPFRNFVAIGGAPRQFAPAPM